MKHIFVMSNIYILFLIYTKHTNICIIFVEFSHILQICILHIGLFYHFFNKNTRKTFTIISISFCQKEVQFLSKFYALP